MTNFAPRGCSFVMKMKNSQEKILRIMHKMVDFGMKGMVN